MITNLMMTTLVAALLVGQQAAVDTKSAAEGRLKLMRRAAESYRITLTDKPATVLQLQADPAFHHGKQPGDEVEEGAIFFWTGEGRRPEVAAQLFMVRSANAPDGDWTHEFTSLSGRPLTATRNGRSIWAPQVPGLEFKPIPGAPKPAESPTRRMNQMSGLAREFRATDDFRNKGWTELRLLTKPVARYGEQGTSVLDGALFAFVQGTDPEVFLLIEETPGVSGPQWRYALAPMSTFALKVSLNGTDVWEVPFRWPVSDPAKPLLQFYPDRAVLDSSSR